MDQEHLKPKAPYVKRRFVPLPFEGPIIPTWTETKWTIHLPEYKAPDAIIKAAYGHDGRKVVARNFMPSVLNDRTYARHFQYLLWIEEEQRRLAPL
jgi:helicase MOV-10